MFLMNIKISRDYGVYIELPTYRRYRYPNPNPCYNPVEEMMRMRKEGSLRSLVLAFSLWHLRHPETCLLRTSMEAPLVKDSPVLISCDIRHTNNSRTSWYAFSTNEALCLAGLGAQVSKQ